MVSKQCVNFVKFLEGFAPLEYTCVSGKRVIGYGHILAPEEVYICGVSEKKAEDLLKQDLDIIEKAIDSLVHVELKKHQKDALICFAFSIGLRAFKLSSLLKMLNEALYDQIPKQIMRWIYVDGRVNTGLMRRRQAESGLFAKRAGYFFPLFS